jgi:anti-sigma B factor antagonist
VLLRIKELPDGRGLLLGGELDLSNANDLLDVARSHLPAGDGDLVMDLAEVTFMDSTGLSILVQIARLLEGKGRLILEAPGKAVSRLFELTGVHGMSNLEVRYHGEEAIVPGTAGGSESDPGVRPSPGI